MPSLPTTSQKNESVLLLSAASGGQQDSEESSFPTGGKWEDEEERRFYEDLQDLRDFVPKSVLGLDGADKGGEKDNEDEAGGDQDAKEKERKDVEQAEIHKLEKEIEGLGLNGVEKAPNGTVESADDQEDECAISPTVTVLRNSYTSLESAHADSFASWHPDTSHNAHSCCTWAFSASDGPAYSAS